MLLDGSGIIFKDELLQKGEQGGENAAKQLHTALADHLGISFPNVPSPKIIAKIFVNLKGPKGLSETCARGGIVSDSSILDDFVRGFNSSIPLFDLVDIGAAKDKGGRKIGGMPRNDRIACMRTELTRLQKASDFISTIAIAIRSSWVARTKSTTPGS